MRARSVFVSLLIIICASISCNGRNNIVGRVSCEGKGIKGVVFSDGISTVQTDSRGRYKMHSEKENGYVFISMPSGYEAERDGIIPRHFVRLEGMKTDKADFNLKKVDQSDCRIIVATDIHMTGDKRDKDLEQFHKTFYPDIVKTASTSDKPVYSVFLGDMSTDGKWYVNSFGLPEYLDLMKDYPSAVYHIMGNHDNERKGEGSDWDHIGESTYKKVIGPNYYSFNIGDVHFMMLDNIVTYGPQPKGTPKGKFNFGTDYGFNYFIDSTQVEWMKKDLSYISSDTPLIVCMHVPLYYGREPASDGFVAYVKANTSQDMNQFMSMFERFGNVHFLFGHEHRTQTFETEKGRTHHIIGSASAVSWKLHDNNAPIVCSDGTPGGYQIFDISGKEISWQFKSSAAAVEHSQMLSSNINSSTVVMSEDFYAKLKPSCTDEDKLRFAKISGVVVGGLGIVMAIALATFDIASLWDQFNFFLGLLTSGLGGLFMMGIFTKRIGTRAAFAGFFGSIAVLLCCSAFTAVTSTLYGFIGLISCFIIGYLSSFIFGYRK